MMICDRKFYQQWVVAAGRWSGPGNFRFRAELALGFRFQFNVAFSDFNGIFDVVAVVLLADLLGLFLDEGGEGINVPGDVLSGLLLGGNEGVIEALDLLALALIHTVKSEMLRGTRGRGVAYPIHWMVLRFVFVFSDTNSLYGE